MGAEIPKQFLEVSGLPILMHTIRCFYEFNPSCQIIVTLPSDWKEYWEDLRHSHHFTIPHRIVDGGIERYDSIKNALRFCSHKIIGVHDGVRPLVNTVTIERTLLSAKENGSGIPTLPLKESLRKLKDNETYAVDRKNYFTVQTPQFFQEEILLNAYEIPFHAGITDDASLVEEAGYTIFMTEGNEENIKITTPNDLKFAALFLK